MPRYRAPRGTHDLLPDAAPAWLQVEETFRQVCRFYGYGELRTPMFESTDLFIRAVGEHTDIVSKEMYGVAPLSAERGAESEPLTLRPEGTAPTLRAYLEHNLAGQSALTRLFYIAPIFRHERPQAGRLRQHHQVGVEALGCDDPALDAEIIELGLFFLRRLGITGYTVRVNGTGCRDCRPARRALLQDALRDLLPGMCENCRRRYDTNPLRILDCKFEDWDRLLPKIPDLSETSCGPCREHWCGFTSALDLLDIEYLADPRLVRGFDYYVRTAFEITHPALGAQSTLIGGGRYDGLVEELGGPATPGIGFGCGIERLLMIREALGVEPAAPASMDVYLVAATPEARIEAVRLVSGLRAEGIRADRDYLGRSFKAQMRAANRSGARVALILGETEMSRGEVILKPMGGGEQFTVERRNLIEETSTLLRTQEEDGSRLPPLPAAPPSSIGE